MRRFLIIGKILQCQPWIVFSISCWVTRIVQSLRIPVVGFGNPPVNLRPPTLSGFHGKIWSSDFCPIFSYLSLSTSNGVYQQTNTGPSYLPMSRTDFFYVQKSHPMFLQFGHFLCALALFWLTSSGHNRNRMQNVSVITLPRNMFFLNEIEKPKQQQYSFGRYSKVPWKGAILADIILIHGQFLFNIFPSFRKWSFL